MKICFYAEGLASNIRAAGATKGMLRKLMESRLDDQFSLIVRKGSQKSCVLENFLGQCGYLKNWKLKVDPRRRKVINALGILKYHEYGQISDRADIYINPFFEYLGKDAKPVIYTIHDLSAIRIPLHSSLPWHGVRLIKDHLRLSSRHASHLVAVSDFTKRDMIEYDATLAKRTSVIHNGIDPLWFKEPSASEGQNIASQHGAKRPYWIWWGYVTKRKNVEGIVRSYHMLKASKKDIPDVLLIGELGFDSHDLPQLIEKLGLSSNIHLIRYQALEKLVTLVKASEGVLFPSFYEGFGLPVIEGMAQGKPVLISNRGSLPEIAGGLAVISKVDDTEDISKGMEALMDRQQHSETSIYARKKWASQFTYENAAQKYSELIDRLTLRTLTNH